MRLSLLANRRAARLRTRSRKYPSVTRTVQSAAPAPIAWVVPVGAGAVSRFALFAAANETTERLLRDHGDPTGAERSGTRAQRQNVARATRWLYGVRGEA